MSVEVKKRVRRQKAESVFKSGQSETKATKKKSAAIVRITKTKTSPRKRVTKAPVQPVSEQQIEAVAMRDSTLAEALPPVAFPEPALETMAEVITESFPPLVEDIVSLNSVSEVAGKEQNWVEPIAHQEPAESPAVEHALPLAGETTVRLEAAAQETVPTPWARFLTLLLQAWQWAQTKFKTHQVKKRLRVCESVSLGEKRFIAVIQVDGEQFLVGGSSNSVSTLAHLDKPKEFPDIFRGYEQDLSRA